MVFRSEMWVFILSTAIIIILMTINWHKRHFSCGRSFLLLMLGALIWTFSFILETAALSLELKLFFAKIQFIAIAFLPLLWLHLILTYIGHARSRQEWVLLSVIPVITNVFVWFVPRPNLFWGKPALVFDAAPFLRIDYDYGFWFYYVHVPFGYLLILMALIVLIRTYLKSHSIYRYQIMLLTAAILLPMIADILYVLGCSPVKYFNYTTAVFSLSCLIISWALFRYKFLDLLPMARDTVIENMDDGLIVLDRKNRIIDINRAGTRITGITADMIGRPVAEACPGVFREAIEEISCTDGKQTEVVTGDADDKQVFDLRLFFMKDSSGKIQGSVVTLRDSTERARLFNLLREQAIYDYLTGIFNRRHFSELGRQELARIKRNPEKELCVIMMDLDKFKEINDRYGHAAGDQALIAFTMQCQKIIRAYDIFGRLGGDEFAVILPDTHLRDALLIAERIREGIKTISIETQGQREIRVNVSIGVATSQGLNESELELEQLLALADKDMYKQKKPSD